MKCGHCGSEFASNQPRAKYCSRRCRDTEPRVLKTGPDAKCEHCGLAFRPRRRGAKSDTNRFCSRGCAYQFKRQRSARGWINFWFHDCAVCGMRFISRRSSALVCSRACRAERASRQSHSKNILRDKQDRSPRRCRECGRSFVPRYGDRHRAFCSDVCGRKANKRVSRKTRKARERGATLAEHIDPIAVFNRDEWRCHLCGRKTLRRLRGTTEPRAPEIDHIVPLSVGGSHTWDNVACACRCCNAAKSAKPLGQMRLSLSALQ